MRSDYEAIRRENTRRYGTEVGRWGGVLLADRYAERTHFIFELLQNAEDALARRPSGWGGPRHIRFHLTPTELQIRHFGAPFTEQDVRGICGIDEGTKDLTDIGRFGIGFKSVYAVTDRPEIHSGDESFAIEEYVRPFETDRIGCEEDETVFVLPFRSDATDVFDEILGKLQGLDRKTLLFLREIEELLWTAEDGPSGRYRRESTDLGEGVRSVAVVEEVDADEAAGEDWLVFSRPLSTSGGERPGNAELAFLTRDGEQGDPDLVQAETSPLVAYFPTAVETHLGFLVQGPYRTTPSRDNVPHDDSWNEHVVSQTASLLAESLRWLRDRDLLDVSALQCMPLDRRTFVETRDGMFEPLFRVVLNVLSSESLLPDARGGFVPANKALLARTRELRELLESPQLATLFGGDGDGGFRWITEQITRDRTPEIYQYLMGELDVREITVKRLMTAIDDKAFLAGQSEEWIRDLYHFLSEKRALRARIRDVPLVRLSDGLHVRPESSGNKQAYLPSEADTEFPTVAPGVCETDTARAFLESLGLTEPDPVDDVLWHVLPRYDDRSEELGDGEYEEDIRRILSAHATDSEKRRKKLSEALATTPFVQARNGVGETAGMQRPDDLYLPTERLTRLFDGVDSVLFVDDRQDYLRGSALRRVLKNSGAVRYIRPVKRTGRTLLSRERRKQLRKNAGHAETSGQNDQITDWKLDGLEDLLDLLPELPAEEQRKRAELLWKELGRLEERRGKKVFEGTYEWSHYGSYQQSFDAAFVRHLNESVWVPDENGELRRPDSVLFDDIGWTEHPFLRAKIRFKPPAVHRLAEEAGVDVEVFDVLKEAGVTTEEELRDRLSLHDGSEGVTEGGAGRGDDGKRSAASGRAGGSRGEDVGRSQGRQEGGQSEPRNGATRNDEGGSGRSDTGRTPDTSNGRDFVSYVGTDPEGGAASLHGPSQAERLELEESAIEFIVGQEEGWERTSPGNPGFDLYRTDENGDPETWCEVKAMSESLDERPATLSRTQFEWAREQGTSYWLYVVEYAGTEDARVVRIRDPAGKAAYFTFDRGWRAVAESTGSTSD